MNVSKYIKRERAPRPTIHEDDYIEEFKRPQHFSIAGAGRPLDGEISGGKKFAIHKSEKVSFDDFAFDAHERIRAGEHPWDVYGSYGGPLDLPIESKLLFNPNDLTDKEVFVARLQQEAGTANDFTRRLENIATDKTLPELKAEETEFERTLKSLKSELNNLFPGDKGVAERATKEIRIDNAKEKKERIAKPRPRPKIVVEPAISSAPVQKKVVINSPMEQSMKAAAKRLSRAKNPAPPPSSGTATASGAPLSDAAAAAASARDYNNLPPPPPPKAGHKRTDSGESEMSDITSAAAETFSGTPNDINLLVDIGDYFSKSAKLDPRELTQIRSKMKKVGIYLPPNTTTQKGLTKKYKEYIEKHHVTDMRLARFADL